MKNLTPDISVITINYNGIKDTRELINSFQDKVHSVSYEIIVVDNASAQNEAEILQTEYPDIQVIKSSQNLGFSGGNNLGINAAKGRYLLLINNDTYIFEDRLNSLIKRMEQSPHIGVVSPQIKFAFSPQNIQFAGYTPLSKITLRNQLIGFGEPDNGQYKKATPTPYAHGAAMMIKKEIIPQVGLMPEIYFLYYEELDWCSHISNCGYQLWYEPECVIYHKESQSTGQMSPLKTFYLTRNRLLYTWRNRKGCLRLMAIIYQLCIVLPKDSMKYIIQSRPDLLKAAWRGTFAFFRLKNKKI